MFVISTPNVLKETDKLAEKVYDTDRYSALNIQLKKGESIPNHFAIDEVLIVVRKGVVSVTVGEETVELSNDELLHIDPKEPHSLEAKEDSDIIVVQVK